MKFIYFTIVFLVSQTLFSQNTPQTTPSKGTVYGTITDKNDSKSLLQFVNVQIQGTKTGVTSDEKGNYSLSVNPGNYTIVFSLVGYENEERSVKVTDGERTNLNVILGSGNYTLKDVVVKATSANREKETAVLLDQKKSIEIKQSIGAQEMSRKGVSNVESGLTKITGITKVDGRGIFVRGLEDRYNNLLVNDLPIPSNNPFKKIIPLDLFPTDVVSVLETYKTFNANIYGDFAGGTFNIITSKGVKSMTKISFGTGFTTGNNLEKFLISKDANSNSNFFGFANSNRKTPASMGNDPASKYLSIDESANGFGSGYNVDSEKSPLNTSFGILHSEKFNIGKNNNTFNYLFSLNYDNKFQVRQGVDRFFSPPQPNYENNLENKKYKFSTNTTAMVALNFKANRFNILSNTFYLKSTDNTIQDQLGSTNGTTINNNAFIRLNQLEKTSLINTQLQSNYQLTENNRQNVKGAVSFTKTFYSQPDRKSFQALKINDEKSLINYSGNNLFRQFLDVDSKYHIAGLAEYSWKFGNDDIANSHKLTLGYNGYVNKLETSFRFLISRTLPSSTSNQILVDTNTPDDALNSAINNGDFIYYEGTNTTYKIKLDEAINAGYADLLFKFTDKIELNLGVRAESSNRKTSSRNQGSFSDPYNVDTKTKLDILPSINLKYKMNENANLRLAASKTITRPILFEALVIEFPNLDGTVEKGNGAVLNSDNYNLDLKYEIFPTNKEFVAVTAFSKYLLNPIERIFLQSAGSGGQITSYDNSKKAVLFGAEFEFLMQMSRISPALDKFSLGFNTSLMYTKATIIDSNTLEINPTRDLQGASPWLINADLKYDFDFTKTWKNSLTLVYNVYGKRIFAVGTNKLDNYYEMPFNKLDFIWSSKLTKNWDLKFSVDNILNPIYEIKVGEKSTINIVESDLTVKNYKRGTGFSFNLSYTF
jgi:CarboxypepD_reg-like domain/TonB dependent receptor/TonB-dependent Receptor Plug Domain